MFYKEIHVNSSRKRLLLWRKSLRLIKGGNKPDKSWDMLPSKWAKLCKSTVNSSIVSFICGTTWKFSLVHPGLTSLSPPALFPLQSECNQLWHEKTRSLSVRTRASLPLTVLCWLSSTSPKTASLSLSPSTSLTSSVLMNIKMPLGPPKHLWSLGWQGLALWSCTLSPPSADYCSPLGLCCSHCEK